MGDKVHQRRWWILAVLCLSLLIIVVDNSILNVALPTLARPVSQGGLDATTSQLQWMVDAYTLVFASLLLTAGSLGDRFGRKGALSIGLLIFGAGSAFAAFTDSAGALISARAVMGIGGALIMPATLSIVTNVFPATQLASCVLGAVRYGIIEARAQGWTEPAVLTAFVAGAVLLSAFVAWELHTDEPVLDVRFFQNPRFSGASIAISLVFFALFGSIF